MRMLSSVSELERLLVAEVYEEQDPLFWALQACSLVNRCAHCAAAVGALALFREPPADASAMVACGTSDPRAAAMTADGALIIGLCGACLSELLAVEVLLN